MCTYYVEQRKKKHTVAIEGNSNYDTVYLRHRCIYIIITAVDTKTKYYCVSLRTPVSHSCNVRVAHQQEWRQTPGKRNIGPKARSNESVDAAMGVLTNCRYPSLLLARRWNEHGLDIIILLHIYIVPPIIRLICRNVHV